MAEFFDCCMETITNWRKALKLPPRTQEIIDKELFAKMWLEGQPASLIAKKLHTSIPYVYFKRASLHLPMHGLGGVSSKPLTKAIDVISYLEQNGGYMRIHKLYEMASNALVERMVMKGELYAVNIDLGRGTGGYKRFSHEILFKEGFFPYKFICNSRSSLVRLLSDCLNKPGTSKLQHIATRFLKNQKLTNAEVIAVLWRLGCRDFSPSQIKSTIQVDGIIQARIFSRHNDPVCRDCGFVLSRCMCKRNRLSRPAGVNPFKVSIGWSNFWNWTNFLRPQTFG
jgi:hypothetical protein